MTYESSDKEWFTEILKRELEVKDMLIHKEDYKGEYCNPVALPVWMDAHRNISS